MKFIDIKEIRINDDGELLVKPTTNPDKVFRFVYRAEMEVDWDDIGQQFTCPNPRKWSYFDWYKQVLAAVVSEMGITLVVTNKTTWFNISAELQDEITNHNYGKNT